MESLSLAFIQLFFFISSSSHVAFFLSPCPLDSAPPSDAHVAVLGLFVMFSSRSGQNKVTQALSGVKSMSYGAFPAYSQFSGSTASAVGTISAIYTAAGTAVSVAGTSVSEAVFFPGATIPAAGVESHASGVRDGTSSSGVDAAATFAHLLSAIDGSVVAHPRWKC